MKMSTTITTAFISSNEVISNNSLNPEVICNKLPIAEGENVFLWSNPLLEVYLNDILMNSHISNFQEVTKYYMNPKKVSKDLYGVSDYWYLIMSMNNYNSIYEFKDFTSLLVPNGNFIDDLVTKLERDREDEVLI